MQPELGWTALSSTALEQAARYLDPQMPGVRDELGFLILHQRYADRFFPGTSVLQTRLRYIFFVPWMYNSIREPSGPTAVWQRIRDLEVLLAKRLNDGDPNGVIGGNSWPKPTSQPASMVYWTALRTWGILRPRPDGSFPSRAAAHRRLAAARPDVNLPDGPDHNEPFELPDELFGALPKPPEHWKDSAMPLTFQLSSAEDGYARRWLQSVPRPDSEEMSVLAELVARRVSVAAVPNCWHEAVLGAARRDDKASLQNAGCVAALAAVGRAVYAALVETIRAERDGRPTENKHRRHLDQTIRRYRDAALRANLEQLDAELSNVPTYLTTLLRETQRWLQNNHRQIHDLHELYANVEQRRKGLRARLPLTETGRERRAEWTPGDLAKAAPLHYRWGNVERLLNDLEAAGE